MKKKKYVKKTVNDSKFIPDYPKPEVWQNI